MLPICAVFNTIKYKLRKPVPSDNTYVSVEGALAEIEIDINGHTLRFVICIDNINILGKASTSTSLTGSVSEHSHFPFSCRTPPTVSLQLLLLLCYPSTAGNTSLTHLTPEFPSPLLQPLYPLLLGAPKRILLSHLWKLECLLMPVNKKGKNNFLKM
jgi:hypothetical protein